MKKKKIFIVCTVVLLAIGGFIIGGINYRSTLIERDKMVKISNTAVEYLMGKDTFQSEVFEEAEVKYDKDIEMYIVTVKFENNPRKALVIVSPSNEVSDIN